MWTRSYSIVTKQATKEQLWKLFSDVNNWYKWDKGIEYARLEGAFEQGSTFELKPKGGPKVKIELVEAIKNSRFTDLTKFPLARMYGQHVFEDTAEGIRITTTMKVQGPLGFFWRKIVAQGIVDALPLEMEEQVKYAATL